MEDTAYRAVAIVGAGAILPDAPNVAAFWQNVKSGRYSISEVSPDRWDPALYYDADHSAPDKTYSKIGGWVREYEWDPLKWHMAVPPRVVDAMDEAQKWAIACTRQALEDYGYPKRPLNTDRTAVILGNAMAGEKHYFTSLRVHFPEYARELGESTSFAALPEPVRQNITRELRGRIGQWLPEITEDSMPGELANCIAGRIANIYNFHGPNFVTDAACASAMAAMNAAVEGLVQNHYDVAVTGGIDRNMGAPTFVKFCKIGALSATGTRPYAEGADGFVMGEGAVIFLLKRLADAERDGDRIYAVLRGMGASSDGKGKGITAPNPAGQRLCIRRAWENAGLSPATVTLMEGHGTSTRVGDVVEVDSMADVLRSYNLPVGSVPIGSVKSNIGHLKGAAGAAGILKVALALRDKVLPPSAHCEHPSADIDFEHWPLYVNRELKPWTSVVDGARRAGVSAFGFGGTNFHAVLEEYVPHRLNGAGKRTVSEVLAPAAPGILPAQVSSAKPPLRGALVIGAPTAAALAERVRQAQKEAASGNAPAPAAPAQSDLRAAERLAIDYTDAADLADKSTKALKALSANQPAVWKVLRAQGIFRGNGPAPKVAFLYTGQGSQYVNMLQPLRAVEPIVAETFAEADRVMAPILGKPLSDFIFVDGTDPQATAKAEEELRQTAITQPAVLASDLALTRMLAAYGIRPDMTMGHSLGEYGALQASGALPFADALEAVAARGREMTRVSMADNGRMAAVFAPLPEIERILKTIDGYVVIANYNSGAQAVIGGASAAVEHAVEVFKKAGYDAIALPVSHAFHTSIVAPASQPLRQVLERLHLESPRLPIVTNVTGEFYPVGPAVVPQMLDILARQVASPVQFVKGLRTLYDAGARVFVEVGPKKALQGFAEEVLGDRGDVLSLFTNHPKFGDVPSFNQALCGLYAAGLGTGQGPALSMGEKLKAAEPPRNSAGQPVAITGAALGLPGSGRIFDDSNVARILRGEQLIDVIPSRFRRAMLDKNVTRLVKSANGEPTFESLHNMAEVIKLAGRGGAFDLEKEFGVSAERVLALDRATQLAMAAGLDALRDAGIPLVMRYKTTSRGTQLPEHWGLPDALRDDTGVIFACVFPGFDSFSQYISGYHADRTRREQIAMLEDLRARSVEANGHSGITPEIDRRLAELRGAREDDPYIMDRRFLFRVLSMGHSQFAEFIGARGPNTQLNAACASTTQAVSLAGDWIGAGRCRRVVVISGDDITTDHLVEWFGAGFLASGAAATDDVVEEAATPFDRRRHGMIMGMGAAAMVIESAEAARERGIRPICEVLSAVTANSAFHGTRLNVEHIGGVMESLVAEAEARSGVSRDRMAPEMVFVSHETYTPARGGSAAAEVHALRHVFHESADRIVMANTKGFTGHAMGTGIEDVVAVKALETGCVPPVANFKEMDPELGPLHLSRGGAYPVEYALRLGAGFGSQISMTLMRRVASKDGVRPSPRALGYASRIADTEVWSAWLTSIAGHAAAELEVVQRTLRVRDRMAALAPTKTDGRTVDVRPVEASAPATLNADPPEVVQPKPELRKPEGPKPPAPKPEAARPAVQADPVKDRILALVAEKTGYPSDMLDLDLDLEADLGVDTVKQADLFATIREAWGIPRDDKIRLRDFPTLAHVIGFVHDRRPDLAIKPPAPSPEPVSQAAAQPASLQAAPSAPDPVKERLLALVAEKTGYPADMLDPDLDLEADLGVDTVKQADLLASVREIYDIPRDENRKLRDYPTLAHVIQFVYDKRPDLKAQPVLPPQPSVPAVLAATVPTADPVKARILALVAEKTGYPADMLDPDLDLEADLGVDTVKQADLFASVREIYNIPRDEDRKLRDYPTMAHVIQFVYDKRPDLKGEAQSPMVAAPPPAELAAPPAPFVEPPSPQAADPVKQRILALVAEKTGYPADMLDVDLDLEADLGVDTVKQADLFASVRAIYNIPRDENRKLRDFPTMAHVIKFVHDNRPDLAREAAVTAIPAPTPAAQTAGARSRFPRRVPVPGLRPPLEMCKPTGVTLGPGRRVAIMPDKGVVGEALAQKLQSEGVEVLLLDGTPITGPVHGIYWLPALDSEGSLLDMDLATWREALRVRVKSLFSTMRALYEQIATPDTFLVAATRLGGQHGYDQAGATAPMGGAVAGFTKTYKRERMDALVKTVDFQTGSSPTEVADALIAETLRDPGAVEIGHRGGLRWTVSLDEQPAADGQPGLKLDKDTVFLITGAAGSIVSAITADLAAASGGTFYLLDLTPEPDANNADLRRLTTDKEGLMRDLHARIKARGERATPALVEKELAALERAQAAQTAIDAVRSAGGTAHYCSLNLTDADAVANVIAQVRERSGRIDVLLHAAGFERSRFLPDKDPREFDLVFDVKADGWFNLLHAIGDMPLGATVAFSSIAGRFGNAGQADYSSANDLLCKIASSFRTTRPGTRGIAIDWTAWGGIGMATRGSIPEMMARAGIDMLPPEIGIPLIRQELTAGGTRGEIVVAGGLGIMQQAWDATGGVETNPPSGRGPLIGKIAGMTVQGILTIETTLDPAMQPFLHDHQIEGKPVLPGVMGIESFAEAALCMLPGWHVDAIEEVNFLAPFKFYRSEPRTLTVEAVFRPSGEAVVAECRLNGSRSLPNQNDPQVTTHFTARVRLTREQPERGTRPALGELAGSLVEAAAIYKVFFHGPAYQVLERAWFNESGTIGQFFKGLPGNHHPPELPLMMAPRLIELCFQAAALGEVVSHGRIGLPLHVQQVRLQRSPDLAEGPLFAVITRDENEGSFKAEVVDTAGNCYLNLRGYRMVEHPDAVDATPLRMMEAALV